LLTIRTEQLRVLGQTPRTSFEAELANHFFRYYPNECLRVGRDQVLKLVRSGIGRAFAHGYSKQREAGLYINLMMMLGSGFDRDPQIPWAARQLNDGAIGDSFERIQHVFQSAVKYLEDCFGPKNGEMVRTLVRLRDSSLSSAPQSEGLQLRADLRDLLKFLAPRKFAVDGEDAVRELIEESFHRAIDYGMADSCGVSVFACLMFLLGARFDSDPMYPWAGEILRVRAARNEDTRAAALHAAAMRYVGSVLSE
jgi:hypothetical protein